MGAGASTDIGPQIAGASDADLKTALDALTAEQREKLTGALSSVTPRSDPPHDIFKDFAQVQEQMKEYLAKEPYEVEVGINKVKVKLHHNPKGATEHTNIMSKVLTEELYNQMAARITKNGITFGKVIQTGVQNPGHPTITTVGAVAGDAECFETFKEFFDPVISLRHNGYAADAKHPSDLDYSKLHKFEPNEKDAARIRSTRVRTGRSLSGLPLPPSCNKAERREIEEKITTSLLTMEGDLKGDYYPLSGSQSYGAKLGGMSAEEEEQFRTDHFLFQVQKRSPPSFPLLTLFPPPPNRDALCPLSPYCRSRTRRSSSRAPCTATGPTPAACLSTTRRTPSCGSTRRTTCASSPWKWGTTSSMSSSASSISATM